MQQLLSLWTLSGLIIQQATTLTSLVRQSRSGKLKLKLRLTKPHAAQAQQSSRESKDEDGALVDKIPDTMVSKVADMLSNALGNGRLCAPLTCLLSQSPICPHKSATASLRTR